MPHMHWVAQQNKLELPNDEEEVNTQKDTSSSLSHFFLRRFVQIEECVLFDE